MQLLQSMLDAWNSPPTRHAMFVHMPIALSMVGAALALLAAVLPRNKTARFIAIACQIAVIAAAYLTVQTGEQADDAIKRVMTPEVYDVINQHEEMAEKVWLFGAGSLALLGLAAITKNKASVLLGWIAALSCLATIGWVGATADHGGQLVYKYGVGTPQPVACVDIPGVHSDGRDHAADRAAQTAASAPASAPADPASGDQADDDHGGGRGRGDDDDDAAGRAPAANAPPTGTAGSNAPVGSGDSSANQPAPDPVKAAFFSSQVLPILSDNCFGCHNSRRLRGGLNQTSRDSILRGGKSGPAIVPGKPEESLLLKRLRGEISGKKIMPPDGQLPAEQIKAIEQWIRDGVAWPAQ